MKKILKLTTTSLLLVSPVFAQAITYNYDSLSRLTKVDYLNGKSITYSYDSAGNILSTVSAGQSTDSDGDGVIDSEDAFPNDKNEWEDSDGDSIGNNTDLDDDNDTIPDTWEIQYGLNPLDDFDAQEDADSDNYSNLQEYRAGTNPNDSNDFPKPASSQGTDLLFLFLQSIGGQLSR
jgi:YD repeat-containing protein